MAIDSPGSSRPPVLPESSAAAQKLLRRLSSTELVAIRVGTPVQNKGCDGQGRIHTNVGKVSKVPVSSSSSTTVATGVVQRSTNIMNFFGGGEAAKPAGPDPLFAGVFIVFRGRPRKRSMGRRYCTAAGTLNEMRESLPPVTCHREPHRPRSSSFHGMTSTSPIDRGVRGVTRQGRRCGRTNITNITGRPVLVSKMHSNSLLNCSPQRKPRWKCKVEYMFRSTRSPS